MISKASDLEICLKLRRIVFIEEQNVPEDEEVDEYDKNAIHLLAFDGDTPVGTARIVLQGEVGKIGRVCVLQSHRGTGLGADLINATLAELRTLPDVTTARLGAQTHALGFFQALGFTAFGDEYIDAGIAHFDMERQL
ncbi:drug:proton antiporter [Marinosulfonomonas sp. PRT-SC04]|nr:drug:proton antiporter [Marinosulfonomonas sp. PRT-SC04]